jgi:hypothetical protein
MVIPFRRRHDSDASVTERERRLATNRRALTVREITHRQRMLSHLARLAASRAPRRA